MTNEEAIKHLNNLIEQNKRWIKKIKRKRSWRDSEKAMAMSQAVLENKALRMSINLLRETSE